MEKSGKGLLDRSQQDKLSEQRGMPSTLIGVGTSVTSVTGETTGFFYYSGSTLTADAGQAAGVRVVARVAKGRILNDLGVAIGTFENNSLSFTSTAFTTEVAFPFSVAEAYDQQSGLDKLNAITSGFTNGQYCVDYRTGTLYGRKASTQTSLTSTAYKSPSLMTTGGGPGGGVTFDAAVVDGDLVKADVTNNELDPVTGISEELIVSTYDVATFTNTAGTQLTGSTLNNFTLNWTYNRNSDNPHTQSIDNGIGAIALGLRTRAVVAAGLTSSTTYTLSGTGDDTDYSAPTDNPFSLSQTISFRNYRYFGVSNSVLTTGAQIITAFDAAPTREFISAKAVSKAFNAASGTPPNYLYYSYPTSFGAPSATTMNGLTFTDYTVSTVSLTNSAGYTEDYYIVRTNNASSSGTFTWAITS